MEIVVDLFNQHGGNLKILKRMIELSYLSGADVAKIQILNSQRIWGNDLRKFLELTFDEVKDSCDGAVHFVDRVLSNLPPAAKALARLRSKAIGKIYYAWGKALECASEYEEARSKFTRYLASGDTDWTSQATAEIGRMDQYLDYDKKKKQKAAQGS